MIFRGENFLADFVLPPPEKYGFTLTPIPDTPQKKIQKTPSGDPKT